MKWIKIPAGLTAAALVTAGTWIATGVTVATVTAVPSIARACRDCPFPMKIAQGRWLMPNGQLELEIADVQVANQIHEIYVILRNTQSREVVADGFIRQRTGTRILNLQMHDEHGRNIDAMIRFVDPFRDPDKIQTKFTCNNCSIGHLLQ